MRGLLLSIQKLNARAQTIISSTSIKVVVEDNIYYIPEGGFNAVKQIVVSSLLENQESILRDALKEASEDE